MTKTLLIILSLIFLPLKIFGNCLSEKISLEEKASLSTRIVEAEITQKQYFWNAQQTHIYTAYTLAISNQLGNDKIQPIILLEKGGTVGEITELVIPSFQIPIGTKGLFLLAESQISIPEINQKSYQLTAGSQSFYAEENINFQLYSEIENIKQQKFLHPKTTKPKPTQNTNKAQQAIVINSISPSTISAGTGDILTISGSGFLAQGENSKIQFRNPDLYGATIGYLDAPQSLIVSWTDTEIQIKVPGRDILTAHAGAGSGRIKVINDLGQIKPSTQTITVTHNQMLANETPVQLINDNNFGGYTFDYNSDLEQNTQAVQALERGIQAWQNNISSPFVLSGQSVTADCDFQDGYNIISFDDNCMLPLGTLSQTVHWFNACSENDYYFFEIDIIFSTAFDWHFAETPTPTDKKDFETVLIHEFGHAHGLGHCLNETDVMFPAIDFGEKNTILDANSIAGGMACISNSIPATCPNTSTIIPIPASTETCNLSLSVLQNSTCNNGEINYLLTISDVNGGELGFNLLVDGELIASYPYNPLALTNIDLDLVGNFSNHTIEVQDIDDATCSDTYIIAVPDCTCQMNINSINQTANCTNGELEYVLNLDYLNGFTQGFDVYVNGNLYHNFNYETDGNSLVNLMIQGDGNTQTISIYDALNNDCFDSQTIETPDCNCDISASIIFFNECNPVTNQTEYLLSISGNNTASNFNIFIDGSFYGTENFTAGITNLIIPIISDGQNHIVTIEDANDINCSDTVSITSEICNCELSISVNQQGECDTNSDLLEYLVSVNATNTSSTFNYLLDGNIIATTNEINQTISIQGDGMGHTISVEDASDGTCLDSATVTPNDCECGLTISVNQQGECDTNSDLVEYLISVNATNTSSTFNYLLDGNIIATTGETSQTISAQGDGMGHIISVEDASDAVCSDSATITPNDCECSFSISVNQQGECDINSDLVEYLVLVNATNSSGTFNYLLDGNIIATTNETNQTISVPGDGMAHIISVEDASDGTCLDSATVTPNDCECGLTISVNQQGECDTNSDLVEYLVSVNATNSSGTFNYLLDGNIIATTNEINQTISVPGDGMAHIISVEDVSDSVCSDSVTITPNDCECSLSISVNQQGDCDTNSDLVEYLISVNATNTSSTFNYLLDGNIIATTNETNQTISVPGDGVAHIISVEDASDGTCLDSATVTPNDCECSLSISVNQQGDCDTNSDLVEYLVLVNATNTSSTFNYLLDGNIIAITGETSQTISVPGDGMAHTISVEDASDSVCSDSVTITPNDCECGLTISVNQQGDCDTNSDLVEYLVSVNATNSSGTFNYLLDGNIIATTNETSQTISVSGDGITHTISVEDVSDGTCLDSATVTPNDCECSLSISVNQQGDCDTNSDLVEYLISVNATNTSSTFNYLLDGNIIATTGETSQTISVPGDGITHIISVEDASDGTCLDSATVTPNDCECGLSISVNQQGECDTNSDLVEYLISVNATNSSATFNYLLDGNIIATTNEINQTISIQGDGITHTISVEDASDGTCLDSATVTPNDCECGLTISVNQQGECDTNSDLVEYLVSVNATNSSGTFNYLLDGNIIATTGETSQTISAQGDGMAHTISVEDVSDSVCSDSTTVTPNDCECSLMIANIQYYECEENLTFNVEITLNHLNIEGQFNYFINGQLVGENVNFSNDGITDFSITLEGNNENYILYIQAINDINCTITTEIEGRFCEPIFECTLSDLAFELLQTCVFDSLNQWQVNFNSIGMTGNYTASINENVISQDTYNSTGINTFNVLNIVGENQSLQIQDSANNECFIDVFLPNTNCEPEVVDTCSITIQALQIGNCDSLQNILYSIEINGNETISDSFNVFINDSLLENSPFAFTLNGSTFIETTLVGNGTNQTISIVDFDDENCKDSITIDTPICTSDIPCNFEVNYSAVGECTAMQTQQYQATIFALNDYESEVKLLIDNVEIDTFSYSSLSSEAINFDLPSDGLPHSIQFIDIENEDCEQIFTETPPLCYQCNLQILGTEVFRCLNDEFTAYILVSWTGSGTFDIYIDDEKYNTTPYSINSINSYSVKLQCKNEAYNISVVATDNNECFDTTEVFSGSHIIVHPTLNTGNSPIYITGLTKTDGDETANIYFYKIDGDIVDFKTINITTPSVYTLPPTIQSGLYILHIHQGEYQWQEKILIVD